MSSEARRDLLLEAVRVVLRPLARLHIREQVPFPVLSELLKSTFVEEAERGFRLPDKDLSDSRITLLTGVHRKDVKRLRAEAGAEGKTEARVSLGAQLIADWNALPQFLDAGGRPVPLYRNSTRGRPSVRDLTETAGQDIRPQAIIDEWLRQGVIVIDDQNRVCLKHDAFVPEHDFEEKVQFFGRNLGTHAATSAHNIRNEGPPLLDQAVYYGGLSDDSATRLARRARELAMRALRTLNREAHELQRSDEGKANAAHRIHFGAYFHREPEERDRNDD